MSKCLAVLTLAALAITAWAAAPQEEGRVRRPPAASAGRLLIVADELPPMQALTEFLRVRGRYDVVLLDQKEVGPALASFDAVFMYVHGKFLRSAEKVLIDYTTAGGRLVILHHGIASARTANPDWLRLTGIRIPPRDHPTHPWRVVHNATHTLVNLKPGHYITSHQVTYDRKVEYASPEAPEQRGKFPALDIEKTEVFLNQQFTDGKEKTVLFGSLCTDPESGRVYMQDRGGWYKPAGKGWVFYLQPGHAEADFRDPNYCQIIRNCLTWQPDRPPAAGLPETGKP